MSACMYKRNLANEKFPILLVTTAVTLISNCISKLHEMMGYYPEDYSYVFT